MARSLSNVKIISVFLKNELSNAIFKRGFAVVSSEGSVSSGGTASAAVLKKKVGEELSQKAPWIPDPKTGFYRPETVSDVIDPAELRALLLNNKQSLIN